MARPCGRISAANHSRGAAFIKAPVLLTQHRTWDAESAHSLTKSPKAQAFEEERRTHLGYEPGYQAPSLGNQASLLSDGENQEGMSNHLTGIEVQIRFYCAPAGRPEASSQDS